MKKPLKNFEIRFNTKNSKKEFVDLIVENSTKNKTFIFETIFFQGVSMFLNDLKNDLSNLDFNLERVGEWVNGERYINEIYRFVNFAKTIKIEGIKDEKNNPKGKRERF